MKRTRPFLALALSSLLAVPMGTAFAPPAAAAAAHPGAVSEEPVDWTPHVLDGSVKSIVQVGDTVVVGGDFSSVADPVGGKTLTRKNIFAFEYGTGRISSDFTPVVDGTVLSLVVGPEGTVYAGGGFTTVNGSPSRGITQLSVPEGTAVSGFTATVDNGSVRRLARHGSHLYAGGSFSAVGGQKRSGLVRLDAATGAVDPGFDIAVSHPRRGPLRLQELALSPDGRRLLINGTFTRVDGRSRPQIAMIDTGSAALSDWSTGAYAADCDYSRMHTYMRQMDFSPDGSYFAVVTAGGPDIKPGLCKTVARFETTDRPGAAPTWINHTGGDSLYSVAVTGAAVYVGGHQRWMDNPRGSHHPGPGSVRREGIAAVDPATGRSLSWNPGRSRGHGAEALTATGDGLFVGSDTELLAGQHRARLGMFPLP